MRAWLRNSLISTGVFLGSCTLEPKYEVPTFAIANEWKTHNPVPSLQYENWWDPFQDPVLADFIAKVIANNQDLIAAQARVEQARDIAKIARAKLFPWFNANLTYENQSIQQQIYGPNLPYYPFVTREHQREYALPLTMNYEVDLWGKIRSTYKAADLNTEARQDAYNGVMLLTTTELANAYFQARILDSVTDAYEAILQMRRKTVVIYRDRYEKKLIDYSQVAQAEADLDRTVSMYEEAKQKRAVFENMMAVLMGESPSCFHFPKSPLTDLPPHIPEGVPAQILTRRPDLAEMERHMASIHALLGVSYANYFPTVDVNGAIGSNAALSKYFLKGLSWFWGIGANLTEVLFDGLARYYKVQLNWAQFNESIAQYQQGILNATQEVENALSNLQWLEKRMASISHAIGASKTNATISSDRFSFGVDSFLPFATKEIESVEDDLAFLTLMGFRYSNTVQLIRALGGGW